MEPSCETFLRQNLREVSLHQTKRCHRRSTKHKCWRNFEKEIVSVNDAVSRAVPLALETCKHSESQLSKGQRAFHIMVDQLGVCSIFQGRSWSPSEWRRVPRELRDLSWKHSVMLPVSGFIEAIPTIMTARAKGRTAQPSRQLFEQFDTITARERTLYESINQYT